MAKAKTSSFVTEVELRPTGKQAKKMRARFEAARQVYNACLGEVLKRLRLMRESKDWQRARKLKDSKDKKDIAERKKLYRELPKRFDFSEYSLHKWTTQFTKSWINEHLGSHTVQVTATTAFKACKEYLFDGGKRTRPKFRRRGDLRAVDGKSGSCVRWKDGHIAWKGLKIELAIDPNDPVIAHGTSKKVKYVRMVRRVIRGKERFFAQLVCEGEAYKKESHRPKPGVVGLDIGTQTIAYVGEKEASLEVFCQEIMRDDKKIRLIQRALDRSRRANNPDNFNEDGTIRKQGNKRLEWKESKRYQQLRKQLANILRSEQEYRKNLHGQLVARVLQYGDEVKTEKLNYQSWAKRKKQKETGHKKKSYGKSIGRRAPGFFLARLKVEAEKWGGSVTEFSTRTTKLSQTCHCGNVQKKKLHVRRHKCPECGAVAQRDLYSAYLARYVEKEKLQAGNAQKAWSSNCAALEAAWNKVNHANGMPSSLGLRVRDRAGCLQNGGQNQSEITDVVAGDFSCESRKELRENHQNTNFLTTESDLTGTRTKTSDASGADTG